MTKPVNTGEFSFNEIRLLAGQGCIHLKLKSGFEFLLQPEREDDDCQDSKTPETSLQPRETQQQSESHLQGDFDNLYVSVCISEESEQPRTTR